MFLPRVSKTRYSINPAQLCCVGCKEQVLYSNVLKARYSINPAQLCCVG